MNRNITSLDSKGQRWHKIKRDLWISPSRKQVRKTTQLQKHVTFYERGRMTQNKEPRAQRAEPKATGKNLLGSSRNEFWSGNFWYLPSWISKLLWTSDICECAFPPFQIGVLIAVSYASPTTVCWVCGWQITCLFSSQANRLRKTVLKEFCCTQTWFR